MIVNLIFLVNLKRVKLTMERDLWICVYKKVYLKEKITCEWG